MMMSFMRLGFDLTMLGVESQQVIALRLAKLAMGGPGAASETRRMVSEKAAAAVETGIDIASGADASAVVKSYRKKVRANRRRLFDAMTSGR